MRPDTRYPAEPSQVGEVFDPGSWPALEVVCGDGDGDGGGGGGARDGPRELFSLADASENENNLNQLSEDVECDKPFLVRPALADSDFAASDAAISPRSLLFAPSPPASASASASASVVASPAARARPGALGGRGRGRPRSPELRSRSPPEPPAGPEFEAGAESEAESEGGRSVELGGRRASPPLPRSSASSWPARGGWMSAAMGPGEGEEEEEQESEGETEKQQRGRERTRGR
jgi:hypothetical protein